MSDICGFLKAYFGCRDILFGGNGTAHTGKPEKLQGSQFWATWPTSRLPEA